MNEIMIKGTQEFMGKEIQVVLGGFGADKRVMLAKTIAEIHGVEVKAVNRLISNNISRFKESIDVIDLKNCSACEAPQLLELGFTNMQIGKANNIYLLSERGYAKLIKIMDTDLAWEIHDKLIDEYFEMREAIKNTSMFELDDKDILALKILKSNKPSVIDLKEYVDMNLEEQRVELEQKHNEEMLVAQNHNNRFMSLTELCGVNYLGKHIDGLLTTTFNKWLISRGLGCYEKIKSTNYFSPNEAFLEKISGKGLANASQCSSGKWNITYSKEMYDSIIGCQLKESLVDFVESQKPKNNENIPF